MNLEKMAEKYRDAGYSERNADARVCQDIVLKAIARSNLGRNVTIKGGVVMRSITGNVRRATEDLDLDFIRYSLEDESIRYFISKLNCLEGIRIEIKGNKIEQLSQQEYSGKRVYIIIKDDEGNVIESKIDLGVHANMNIEQDTYCFDVCMDDEGASLLINSCEQIFAEKLRSLLRFGPLSTRYKDIFDFCYLKDHVDMSRLADCIRAYIIDEPSMREKDMNGVRKRVALTFSNRQFRRNVEHSGDRNWLQIDVGVAFKMIQKYHYSNTLPKINKYFLGFYLDEELVGVVTLGWGTRPRHTIQRIFPSLDTKDYLEIGRMCMTEEMPRNSESQMLSQLVKWIHRNLPELKVLFTWADGMVGKVGYVYQVCSLYRIRSGTG